MIWGVNVQSHIHAAKHVLPQMIERGEGYLMNTHQQQATTQLEQQVCSHKSCSS